MSYTVSDTVLRTETQWITLRASSSFPLTCLLPPSFHFPFTHFFFVSLCFNKLFLPLSLGVLSSHAAVLSPLDPLCAFVSRVLTFTEDSATVKWWTLEQRQMREIQSGIPGAATEGNRGDKSQGEENRGGVRECDLGNGFCFQERLGFEAEHFTTDCTVRHALHPLFPLLSYSCGYRGSRSVNTSAHRSESALWIMKFPPLFASLSLLWEHAAAP